MTAKVSRSVGLGGDGDEIVAIADVERAFGIKLDYADAPNWHTAGDVFLSLCKALPVSACEDSDLWPRFAEALAAETGVDPENIEMNSPLLSDSRIWVAIADLSALVWIGSVLAVLALIVWASL